MDVLANKTKDMLALCLGTAINTALVAQIGDKWFEKFKNDDQKQNYPILKYHEQIGDLDFQALLKILRFREEYSELVFSYYEFYDKSGSMNTFSQKKQIYQLLDRLINDFRNAKSAHNSINSIRNDISGNNGFDIYGYQDAITDMTKLAAIFKTVTDENGKSYYDSIIENTKNYYNQSKKTAYSIDETIAKEQLNTDRMHFVESCTQIGIETQSINGIASFISADYNTDIQRIHNHILLDKNKNSAKKSHNIIKALVIFTCILLIATPIILFLAPWNKTSFSDDANESNSTTAVASTTNPSTQEQTELVHTPTTSVNTTLAPQTTKNTGGYFWNDTNYQYDVNSVAIKPKYVRYENGKLIAECFVINGFNYPIYDITVRNLTFSGNNGVICSASFGQLASLSIAPYSYAVWTFSFNSDCISIYDDPLTTLEYVSNTTYRY